MRLLKCEYTKKLAFIRREYDVERKYDGCANNLKNCNGQDSVDRNNIRTTRIDYALVDDVVNTVNVAIQ